MTKPSLKPTKITLTLKSCASIETISTVLYQTPLVITVEEVIGGGCDVKSIGEMICSFLPSFEITCCCCFVVLFVGLSEGFVTKRSKAHFEKVKDLLRCSSLTIAAIASECVLPVLTNLSIMSGYKLQNSVSSICSDMVISIV